MVRGRQSYCPWPFFLPVNAKSINYGALLMPCPIRRFALQVSCADAKVISDLPRGACALSAFRRCNLLTSAANQEPEERPTRGPQSCAAWYTMCPYGPEPTLGDKGGRSAGMLVIFFPSQ